MDTDRFTKAANSIIHDLEELIKTIDKFEVESEKIEYYIQILKINHKAQSFIDKYSLPKIDYSLVNDDMFKSNTNYKNLKYFKPVEYQFNLLLFLFQNYVEHKFLGLRFIIDEFIDKIKYKFNIKDVEITKTGAVRCKTNIRFAIMSLRQFGLINYYDIEDKRNWSPTLLGIFICTYYLFNKSRKKEYIYVEYLEPPLSCIKVNALDIRIEDIIKDLNDKSKFDELIRKLNLSDFKEEYIDNFKIFIKNYGSLINEYYTSFYPNVFTKKYLNERIKILIRDDNKIDNFKKEFIDTAIEQSIMEQVKEILE